MPLNQQFLGGVEAALPSATAGCKGVSQYPLWLHHTASQTDKITTRAPNVIGPPNGANLHCFHLLNPYYVSRDTPETENWSVENYNRVTPDRIASAPSRTRDLG